MKMNYMKMNYLKKKKKNYGNSLKISIFPF